MCGDTHGDNHWVRDLVAAADRAGCSRILICGDFGYWVHYADGRQFLTDCDSALSRSGVTEIVFIDGNHEYHSTHPAKSQRHRRGLRELVTFTHDDGTGFAYVSEHVRYATRGARWQWGATRFAALGGAASTDREQRKPFRDFWVDETPTRADLEALGSEAVDVLVCHDAPGTHEIFAREDRVDDPRSLRVRALLSEAVEQVTPRLVFHGHWHHRYNATLTTDNGEVEVVGLGANVDNDGEPAVLTDSAVIFDTETGAIAAVAELGDH